MAASCWSPQTEPRPKPRQLRLDAALLALSAILLLGVLVRAWILAGPLGEVEADESVVGLMALHVLGGERPAFYWGQPYLGSLEAYLVAGAFALLGPSNLALKMVPGLAYLAFVLLVFAGARRDYGARVGLLSAIYLALPPSFLAIWSLKARGGYVELLALGQALLFAAPWVAGGRPGLAGRLALAGLLAGLLLWTHVLGLVYVLPVALYLMLRLHRRLLGPPLVAGLGGALVGLAPLLVYNAGHGWETFTALSGGGASQRAFQENLGALARVGLPVMLGLGQATSSPILFAQDWPSRPASWPWIPPLLLGALVVGLLPSLGGLLTPFRGRAESRPSTAFFGLLILALAPPLASLGRLGELVAEPRYTLPLYAATPLFAAAIVALGRRRPRLAVLLTGLVLVVNVGSLVSADPRLNLPTTAGASTAATRAELLGYLERQGLTEVYTDYWLAYPLMLESQERVTASVSSGGYNRFAPYAYFVSVAERPAFVFVADSAEEASFLRRVAEVGGRAESEGVSIYRVYADVRPLDPMRP